MLAAAAPDISDEEEIFAPRSRAQEEANAGTVKEPGRPGKPLPPPSGAWVEAAKELVPPPPPPEVSGWVSA